jgi:hypothetical protein
MAWNIVVGWVFILFYLVACLPLLASILLFAEMLLAEIFGRLDTPMCLLASIARILLLAYHINSANARFNPYSL